MHGTLMQNIIKAEMCWVQDVLDQMQPVYPDVIGTTGMQQWIWACTPGFVESLRIVCHLSFTFHLNMTLLLLNTQAITIAL